MEVAARTSSPQSLGSLELQCPPLPHTLLEALELMHQPEGLQMDRVIRMVENDPGVTTRVLKVVNSAYYGQRGQITSARRAVLVLGSVSVTGLVMSMGLHEMRHDLDASTAGPFLHLVRHSIATAFLARHMLAHEEGPDVSLKDRPGDAYTAGLLHDFGKLILLYNHPAEAAHLYLEAQKGKICASNVLAKERERFGYDHVETGVYLTRRMKFPAVLTAAIAWHHSDEVAGDLDPETRHLVYLVQAANRAAAALGFSSNCPVPCEQCAADPIWSRLVEERVVAHPDVETLQADLQAVQPALTEYIDLIT
ncbi:HDOD domain-containing protein [Rhodocaloribacter litoris]|uniref:HDOD domain-containing protein n=1 Tax=Rhodocaloribacter litoris TaxID=2558931 RepID=UPI00141E1779|nr:HDOD domain-containing protein [Rhodocaloribacter litoris]QXD16999.1 HDOD domain-containing protein [Rhodocaloribacter litoris]